MLRDANGPHVFTGDETAAVPFAAMLRALPDDAAVDGVLKASGPAGEVPLPANSTGSTMDRFSTLSGIATWPPKAPSTSRVRHAPARRSANTCLRDRRWPRGAVMVKPFWTPGRRGMD
ncbi:hypothetical protein AB0J74_28370 [Asanoa sp. NPDC049573]|uniref:hypothetical protein n=1 Tax=Asanoa sp. NPDC049573 TaxID=3155396 RepID=UPI00342AAE83